MENLNFVKVFVNARASKTEEPSAGKSHAGIREGGIGKLVALP